LHQRVARAGLKSFESYFQYFSETAGIPAREVEAIFGLNYSLHDLRRKPFTVRNHLKWHLGLVPKPSQKARTTTVGSDGFRVVSPVTGAPVLKTVVLTGGSVAFGWGATYDEWTPASRLQHHLNAMEKSPDVGWRVLNYAIPGFNSFQELLLLLQKSQEIRADYVVTLSGWNDVDQQFASGEVNVSGLAQGFTSSLEASFWKAVARKALGLQTVEVGRRFLQAYMRWQPELESGQNLPFKAREIDNPDIYPLF